MAELDKYLKLMVSKKGSDLHLHADFPACVRVHGSLQKCSPVLSRKELVVLLGEILTDEQKKRLNQGEEVDFSYELGGVSRFRGNIFMQDGKFAGVFRAIPQKIATIAQLNLPPIIEKLADLPRGLVLVTGPTGSGKSTTIAAILDHINENRYVKILTIEDPLEFVHKDKKSMIVHKEVGMDVPGYHEGLRSAFREDSDVVLIGEIRDQFSMQSALDLCESGVFVLATLHTLDVSNTVKRVISFYDEDIQPMIRNRFSQNISAIISMRLVPSMDQSRVAAFEILVADQAIRNLIQEQKEHQIESCLEQGKFLGMCTFEMNLQELRTAGLISKEVVEAYSRTRSNK